MNALLGRLAFDPAIRDGDAISIIAFAAVVAQVGWIVPPEAIPEKHWRTWFGDENPQSYKIPTIAGLVDLAPLEAMPADAPIVLTRGLVARTMRMEHFDDIRELVRDAAAKLTPGHIGVAPFGDDDSVALVGLVAAVMVVPNRVKKDAAAA